MSLDLKAGLTRLALAVTAKPGDKKEPAAPKIADEQKRKADEAAEAKKSAPAKKAEPKPKKGDDALHCPSCGSAGPWTILDMNLRVHNVPCSKLSKTGDGHAYDDTKGDSEGWDYVGDGAVKCDKCGNEADVNELIEMAGKAAQGPADAAPIAPPVK